MKIWACGCFFACMLLCSCTRKEVAPKPAAEEHVAYNLTDWTAKTELYLEYPALRSGQTSRFAVHLTSLGNFKPLKAGRVEVILQGPNGPASFTAAGPSSPGIFGVDVKPATPGKYQMKLSVESPEINDTHELGEVTVFADENAAREHPQEKRKEETVAFLKEQQWSLDFGTDLAGERTLRESILIPAQITPRAGGEALVSASFDGRLVTNALPVGTEVSKGQVLAQIVPPTSSPSDLANLELARAEAEAALNLARKESQRAQRLVEAGAIPAKRLDESQTAEMTIAARLRAAEARIAQYDATRSASGSDANAFAVRAPLTGIVAEARATSGANVKAGDLLFKLVDIASVYVEGKLPESELSRIAKLSGAQLEIPGSDRSLPLRRLISLGRLVDPSSRTVSVVYEADNRSRALAVGQAVSLRLTTAGASRATAIPESAIVDDGGRPVVFVQVAGESFARRPVTLGIRDSGYAQVISGVKAKERVVVRGAYLIRLSAMSSQIPAHGHVH